MPIARPVATETQGLIWEGANAGMGMPQCPVAAARIPPVSNIRYQIHATIMRDVGDETRIKMYIHTQKVMGEKSGEAMSACAGKEGEGKNLLQKAGIVIRNGFNHSLRVFETIGQLGFQL
jgi:hypothetical protein